MLRLRVVKKACDACMPVALRVSDPIRSRRVAMPQPVHCLWQWKAGVLDIDRLERLSAHTMVVPIAITKLLEAALYMSSAQALHLQHVSACSNGSKFGTDGYMYGAVINHDACPYGAIYFVWQQSTLTIRDTVHGALRKTSLQALFTGQKINLCGHVWTSTSIEISIEMTTMAIQSGAKTCP
jgi:hypothetical protein